MTHSPFLALPLGRITIGLAALAVIIAGILAGRAVDDARSGAIRVVTIAPQTPLSATLDRCRLSGPGGADDPVCRSAWAESRNRFFSRPLLESSDD